MMACWDLGGGERGGREERGERDRILLQLSPLSGKCLRLVKGKISSFILGARGEEAGGSATSRGHDVPELVL